MNVGRAALGAVLAIAAVIAALALLPPAPPPTPAAPAATTPAAGPCPPPAAIDRAEIATPPPPAASPLLVRVLDGNDAPLADATVALIAPEDGALLARTNVRADGTLQVALPRPVILRAEAPDRGFVERSVRPGHDESVTLRLRAGVRLRGHVRDVDGKPVAGAVVSFETPPILRGFRRVDTAPPPVDTDAAGAFSLTIAADAVGVLRARHGDERSLDYPLAAAAGDRSVDLWLEGAFTCAVECWDEHGQPARHARLVVTGADGGTTPNRIIATGEHTFRVLLPGPGRFAVRGISARNRLLDEIEVDLTPPMGHARCHLRAAACPPIQGRLSDHLGAPLAGFWVTAVPAGSRPAERAIADGAWTDADGCFHLRVLPRRLWRIVCEPPAGDPGLPIVRDAVPSGLQALAIVADPLERTGVWVPVQAVDPDGRPLTALHVSLADQDPLHGRARPEHRPGKGFGPLLPDHPVTLLVTGRDAALAPARVGPFVPRQANDGIIGRLQRLASLVVQVRQPSGRAATGFRVLIRQQGDSEHEIDPALLLRMSAMAVDATGRLERDRMAPEPAKVIVLDDAGTIRAERSVVLQPGQRTEVEIVVD